MNDEVFKRLGYLICEWHSNWEYKQFSLGVTIASEPVEQVAYDQLPERISSDTYIPEYLYQEHYVLLFLGFWQLSLGVRTRKN